MMLIGGTVAGASPDSDTAVTDYERHLDLDRAVASELLCEKWS